MVAQTAVNSLSKYLGNNIMGSWNAGTWNVLPAVLTTWSNLLANQGNKSSYDLYKEQAKSYIETAKMNADLIKSEGEIALRNLEYKNKLQRGNDIVRVAASGGHLSGSNLDVLVRKEKIRKMNETTLKANYSNQVMLEMVNGYRQAGQTYLNLSAKAKADKYTAIASILKGVETYVGLQVRDAKVEDAAMKGYAHNQIYRQISREDQNYMYGIEETTKPQLRGKAPVEETTQAISLNNTMAPVGFTGTFESIANY